MEETLLLCIDDTDTLDSPGTGEVLDGLLAALAEEGLGQGSFITRHQLLLHPDIPYTSHNSSMCTQVRAPRPAEVVSFARAYLDRACAPGSDPGLCVALPAALVRPQALLEFGRTAKERVLAKADALALAAAEPQALFLSEHGGTGQGIIGALAGCGLRLSGRDGRCRGKLYPQVPGERLTAAAFLARGGADGVCSPEGEPLPEQAMLVFSQPCKAVFRDGRRLAVARPRPDGAWELLGKRELPEEFLA